MTERYGDGVVRLTNADAQRLGKHIGGEDGCRIDQFYSAPKATAETFRELTGRSALTFVKLGTYLATWAISKASGLPMDDLE